MSCSLKQSIFPYCENVPKNLARLTDLLAGLRLT